MSRSRIISIIGIALVASLAATAASAWTGPTASAPNNNVAAPINTSASGQVKTGDFATLGKIGIGTASPNSSYKLTIEGGALNWTTYLHNNYGGMSLGPANTLWSHIYTDNPQQPFIFNANLVTVGGSVGSYNGNLTLGTNSTGTSTTPRMTIEQSSGNVGIGTASPNSRLDVSYSAGPTITLSNTASPAAAGLKGTLLFTHRRASDNAVENLAYIQAVAENNQSLGGLRFVTRNGSDKLGMKITSNGGVVIGSENQYGASPLTVDSVLNAGTGQWAEIVNYNSASPYGSYGVYSYGSVYAMYGSGPIYATSFLYASDARWKHNVKNLDKGIMTLMKLRPVSFTWNDDNAPINNRGKDDMGFIAQEVKEVLPELIHTDPKNGYMEVDYPKLIPVLTQAIQDQQKEIDDLKARIEALEAKIK